MGINHTSPRSPLAPPSLPVPRPSRWLTLLRGEGVLIAVALLTVLFGVLTALVLQANLQPTWWDIEITHEIQEFPPAVGIVLVAVSEPGFPPWNVLMVAGLVVVMSAFRWFEEAFFTLLAAGGAVFVEVIKNVIDRPRPTPEFATVITTLNSYSFPSGHVTTYVAIFGFIFYLAYTMLPRRHPLRRALLTACILLIVLIGPSRVYMGQHWASDALAGYALGLAYLLVVIQTHRAWLRRAAAGEKSPPS